MAETVNITSSPFSLAPISLSVTATEDCHVISLASASLSLDLTAIVPVVYDPTQYEVLEFALEINSVLSFSLTI